MSHSLATLLLGSHSQKRLDRMRRQEKELGITGASSPREETKPKVRPRGPVPTAAAQGGRSPEAPPSEGLLRSFDQAQLSPQKPTALISSPLLMTFPISFPSPTRTPGFARPPQHRGVSSHTRAAPGVPGDQDKMLSGRAASGILTGC